MMAEITREQLIEVAEAGATAAATAHAIEALVDRMVTDPATSEATADAVRGIAEHYHETARAFYRTMRSGLADCADREGQRDLQEPDGYDDRVAQVRKSHPFDDEFFAP